MKQFIVIFCCISMLYGCKWGSSSLDKPVTDKSKLIGNDYRLFQQTSSWDLAKAVYYDDLALIKVIAKSDTVDINFQEPLWGTTLLRLAIVGEKYEVTKLLLELGANPNLHDFNEGVSAIMEAAESRTSGADKARFIKLLLSYGGNPNDTLMPPEGKSVPFKYSVLTAACVNSIEKVKVLVDAGADINYNNGNNSNPLLAAITHNNPDIAMYLLEKGAKTNPASQ
jgi:uncharacterized protein